MKKRQNISVHQLAEYCTTYNIDQNIFENPNDETNKKQIIQIFEHFTGLAYHEDHIRIKQTDVDGESEDHILSADNFPRFWEVSSHEELLSEINRCVDGYNRAIDEMEIIKTSVTSLDPKDRDSFFNLIEQSQQAMDDLNTIAQKRPLAPHDFIDNNRAELIQERMHVLQMLRDKGKPNLDLVLLPIEKDGSFGDAETVHLSDLPILEIPTLSTDEVRTYIRSNSSLDPDILFRSDSFQKNTKEGHDTLNKTLYHFTEHTLVTGSGMEYSIDGDSDKKVVYQRITSFDEINSLDEFVEHMNRVNSHKARNIALLNHVDRDADKNKKDDYER